MLKSTSKNALTLDRLILILQTLLRLGDINGLIYVALAGLCGLRVVEIMNTKWGDFTLDRDTGLIANVYKDYGELLVPNSSGFHIIAVPPQLRIIMNDYIRTSANMLSPNNRIFPSFAENINFLRCKGQSILDCSLIKAQPFLASQDISANYYCTHDFRCFLRTHLCQFYNSSSIERSVKAAIEKHLRHWKGASQPGFIVPPGKNYILIKYVDLIDKALNIPWSIEALEEWKISQKRK